MTYTAHEQPYGPAWRLLASAVRIQLRVTAALVRRETRARYGDKRLGYLWAIIEPVLHLAVYAWVINYVRMRHSFLGGSVILFMLTGLAPYFLFSRLSVYLSGAIEENRSLLLLPPVKPFDVLAARAVLDTTKHFVVNFILFTAVYIGITSEALPEHPIELSGAIVGVAGFGIGVGIVNAVIRFFIHNWMMMFSVISTPLFLLSGIWFLPTHIPPPYRDYMLYNPLMHYIMWFRSGVYRSYQPQDLDRGYAVLWTVAFVMLGLTLLRVFRRKATEPR